MARLTLTHHGCRDPQMEPWSNSIESTLLSLYIGRSKVTLLPPITPSKWRMSSYMGQLRHRVRLIASDFNKNMCHTINDSRVFLDRQIKKR